MAPSNRRDASLLRSAQAAVRSTEDLPSVRARQQGRHATATMRRIISVFMSAPPFCVTYLPSRLMVYYHDPRRLSSPFWKKQVFFSPGGAQRASIRSKFRNGNGFANFSKIVPIRERSSRTAKPRSCIAPGLLRRGHSSHPRRCGGIFFRRSCSRSSAASRVSSRLAKCRRIRWCTGSRKKLDPGTAPTPTSRARSSQNRRSSS